MALEIIHYVAEPKNVRMIIAQERFVVVNDGSRLAGPGESGSLLAAPGGKIAAEVAERLGIGPDGRRIPEPPKEIAPAETKDLQPAAKKRRKKA